MFLQFIKLSPVDVMKLCRCYETEFRSLMAWGKKLLLSLWKNGYQGECQGQVIRVSNDLPLSSDRDCISLLVLLDLSAAFDTIDYNILLNRLENFVGISGSALAWFKSYLSDRHQFVAVNEEVSYWSQGICNMEYLKAQY